MRQPDIHRVQKAIAHLDAAKKVLESIDGLNLDSQHYDFRQSAYEDLQNTKWHLQDMLNI